MHDCNIAVFTPYPGSEIYEELRTDGTIPKITDEYFLNLLVQFDFTLVKAYCRYVSSPEIALYRFLGMSLFYSISYVFHPRRLVRLMGAVARKNFRPNSVFEQRLYDYLGRIRLRRQRLRAD